VFRARSKEDMRRFDDTAARIAAGSARGQIGPAIPLPNLPLVYPADPDAPPAIGWTTVRAVRRGDDALMVAGLERAPRALRRSAGAGRMRVVVPAAREGRVHDITLIASMP
jgi:hypothetical protein